MLCLGSTGVDQIVSAFSYEETILQRNYRKMTILWSLSCNSLVKFHGKKKWEPQNDHFISKAVL